MYLQLCLKFDNILYCTLVQCKNLLHVQCNELTYCTVSAISYVINITSGVVNILSPDLTINSSHCTNSLCAQYLLDVIIIFICIFKNQAFYFSILPAPNTGRLTRTCEVQSPRRARYTFHLKPISSQIRIHKNS